MTKITLHTIGVPPEWAGDYLRVSGATAIKGLNAYPSYPGIETLGRIYMDGTKEPEPLASMIRTGASGADQLFDQVWPEVEKNPHVSLWELYNEAPIWDASVLAGFVPFNQRLIARMHDKKRRICVGAINTYWPRPHQYETIAKACQGADGLSFHEYAKEDIRNDADILHYREFHNWCKSHGYQHPPIWLTEIGLDKTIPPGPSYGHWGWHGILGSNEESYVDQLAWLEMELRRDDYVRAATVFTTGGGWDQFEFGQSVAMKLAHRLASLPYPQPQPEPEPQPEPHHEPLITDLVGKLPVHPVNKYDQRDLCDITRVVIHHTAIEWKRLKGLDRANIVKHIQAIARIHRMSNGWPGIGYHYVIGPGGTIYRTNTLTTVSNHVYKGNTPSIGICMIGRFDAGHDDPTDAQLQAAHDLRKMLGKPVMPHKALGQTACPGRWDVWGHRIAG